MDTIAIANLLSVLLPLGVKLYTEIQEANADQLKPIAEILAAADANWDAVAKAAHDEIAKA
jgi:transcriptional regulator